MKHLIRHRSQFFIVTMILMVLTLIFSTGCKNKKSDSQTKLVAENEPATTLVGSLPSDREIKAAIEKELLLRDGVEPEHLTVGTKEGIVTLDGAVDNLMAKDRAVEIVMYFKGVRGVIDHIQVSDYKISDASLKSNIEQMLLMDPTAESYEVDVAVNGGHVVLTGTVDSWQEKKLTADVVKEVKGVQSIDNNIRFEYKDVRPDQEIKDDIVSALNWDARIDDALLNVIVDNGDVTLVGTVGSAAEKSHAKALAWVAGVNSVDAADVKVKTWARDKDFRTNKYGDKTDPEVKKAITDVFLYDPRIAGYNINVDVDKGQVTLSGTVDNLKTKRVAGLNAENVVGVWKVDNLIYVSGNQFPSDQALETYVDEALSWNPYVDDYVINVDVEDGKATLTGLVDNFFEKHTAEDVTSKVFGIRDIENDISVAVNTTPYVYNYEYDQYYPYHYDIAPGVDTGVKSDKEIKSNIQKYIWWSPFVDAKDVTVHVNDGVATLKGTVDSWKEFYQAEISAYNGGAIRVNNDMEISHADHSG